VPAYLSAVLFHGPGAREESARFARTLGRLLRDFGEGGLKIAESREIIALMGSAPLGDEPGVVVIGPVDRAAHASTDVLLKSIEEFNPDIVRPVLWAYDETEVSPTIRSRCLRRWCPGVVGIDEDALDAAREIVNESLGGHRASVVELSKDKDPRVLLEAAAQALHERGIDDETEEMWARVRATLRYTNPTPTEALAALL
jgi:hypothetical protein